MQQSQQVVLVIEPLKALAVIGTYTVTNYSSLQQSKTYTVTLKACLVSDRTQLGSPSKFLVSRLGLTFPIDWASLTEIPVAAVGSC